MGRSKVTIKDIAREAGVSTALVSFAMNNKARGERCYRVCEETEKKVFAVAERLGYQPNQAARTLRSGDSRIIGVIISDIANKFYAEIAREISEWASKNDYTVIFGNTDEDTSKLNDTITLLENKGVGGFIIVPCENSQDVISSLKSSRIPFVLIDRDFSELGASSVILDNFKASRLLVECLFRSGSRKIEMISYKTSLPNIIDRQKGYLAGLKDLGLESFRVHNPDYGDYSQVEKIVLDARNRGVDGFLFATYRMALLGRKAMIINDINVPESCRVACFNNNEELDTFEKNIFYARQPICEYASKAMELLQEKMKDVAGPEKKVLLEPEIVEVKK